LKPRRAVSFIHISDSISFQQGREPRRRRHSDRSRREINDAPGEPDFLDPHWRHHASLEPAEFDAVGKILHAASEGSTLRSRDTTCFGDMGGETYLERYGKKTRAAE